MKFQDITTITDLSDALRKWVTTDQDSNRGVNKYVYHYTNKESLLMILMTRKWKMGHISKMNDRLEEKDNGNIYIASFSTCEKENMGMWSMYSQPWENGVAIRIPVKIIKKWFNSEPCVFEKDVQLSDDYNLLKDVKLNISNVVYSNRESLEPGENIVLKCGGQINNHFSSGFDESLLYGRVKDEAWLYEKELRLIAAINNNTVYDGLYLDIPMEVIDSFEVITGPRFNANLLGEIRDKFDQNFDKDKIIPSVFTGRLRDVHCDHCKYKNG